MRAASLIRTARCSRSAFRSTAAARRPACSAGAGTRSTHARDRHRRRRRPAGLVPKIRYADDTINMPVQCATHWDSLGHIFYEEKMYNGHDARLVDCNGLGKLGIEHSKNKMVGRGVLLDIAALQGRRLAGGRRRHLQRRSRPMRARAERRNPARRFRHRAHRPDGALPQGRNWGGYAGGDAPGVSSRIAIGVRSKEIAAICSDTWGVEVRPNETTEANQPWHWVVIPAMGLTMGEMFYLKELGRRLRRGPRLRILLLRPAADHHRRHRLADQPAGDQVILIPSPRAGRG